MANKIIDKALAYIGNVILNGLGAEKTTVSSFPYTATASGILDIYGSYTSAGTSAYVYVYVGTVTSSNCRGAILGTANGGRYAMSIPVKKGDVVSIQSNGTASISGELVAFTLGGGKTNSCTSRAYVAQVAA